MIESFFLCFPKFYNIWWWCKKLRPLFEIFVDGKISQILILKRCNLLPSKLQNNEYNHLALATFFKGRHRQVLYYIALRTKQPTHVFYSMNYWAVIITLLFLVYLLLGGSTKNKGVLFDGTRVDTPLTHWSRYNVSWTGPGYLHL